MKLKGLLAAAILSLCFVLTGCWSIHEVNTLGISVCIGIDKADEGYTISEQVINPKAIASKNPSNESPVVVYTLTGGNIHEIITRMTTLTSRRIYSSHLRMVILSEDVAREGIFDIVDYMLRYHEFRTDFYFAIAKGASANEILSILTPIEAIPGVDMFSKLKMSSEEWAPTKAMKIIELANDLASDGINPAITAVEPVDDSSVTDSTDVLKKSGNYQKLRFTNVGVFQKDKLIGWLDENEAKGYTYIMNKVKHTSGYNESETVFASDILKSKSKIKASFANDQPRIDVDIKLTFVLTQSSTQLDVTKVENIDIINKLVAGKAKDLCESALSKAKDLKIDIFGFGEKFHTQYPKYWKTAKNDWNETFASLPVDIRVNAELLSTGDLTNTLKQKE